MGLATLVFLLFDFVVLVILVLRLCHASMAPLPEQARLTGPKQQCSSVCPSPVEAHVSDMLAEATRLHQAAMGELHSPHDNPLPRLKKALKLLKDAEVLADDSASYVDSETMKDAIKQLHQQQGQIQAMIIQLEAQANRSNPLPWVLVGVLALVILAVSF